MSKFVNIDIFIFMNLCFETPVTVPMTLKLLKSPHWRLCPVQRPLGEYVRSSEESGCKCHARMSICRYFPSAKQWGMYCFAVHRRHAKAQSNCRGAGFRMFGALRKRSWHGAMRSFFCMYKKGVFLWDTRDISVRPRHPVPLGEAIWLCYDMETQVGRWGNGQGIRIPCMF